MAAGSSGSSWNLAQLNSRFHTVILVCFVAILSYFAAKFGGTLIMGSQGGWPLWLGNVFLISILLLVPRRIWPILIAAAFAAFILYDLQGGHTIRSIAWLILADAVEVIIATLCLSYFFKGVPRLNSSVRALAKFSLFAVILPPCMGAFFVALGVGGNYWTNWGTSFSEAIVYLTLMPAILGWFSKEPARSRKSRAHYVEAAILIAALVLLFGYLTFGAPGRSLSEVLLYLLVPIMLWSALRFGTTGVSTSVTAIAVLAIWSATHGQGPFVESGPLNSVLSLQLFLLFTAAPFMVLAAVVEQDKHASEQFFRSIFENAQVAINFFSIDGREAFSNRACQEMLGRTEQQLSQPSNWEEMVHPEDRASRGRRATWISSKGNVSGMNGRNATYGGTAALWLQVQGSAYSEMPAESRSTSHRRSKTSRNASVLRKHCRRANSSSVRSSRMRRSESVSSILIDRQSPPITRYKRCWAIRRQNLASWRGGMRFLTPRNARPPRNVI